MAAVAVLPPVDILVLKPTNTIHAAPLRYFNNLCIKERESLKLPPRWVHCYQLKYQVRKYTGDEVLRQLEETLDNFGVERHDHQINFHEKFKLSALPKIYEHEWDDDADRILQRLGNPEVRQETLVVTPRRFGKTWSVAMFCAAFLYCVPKCTISVFSTGQRMARKLMVLCCRMFLRLKGSVEMIKKGGKKTQEQIEVRGNADVDDIRTLCCYPGTVKVSTFFFFFFFFIYTKIHARILFRGCI